MKNEDPAVAEIDTQIAEARTEVKALEERVIAGDSAITADDVGAARRTLDFLGLRKKGAEREALAAEEKRHQAEVADFETRFSEWSNGELESLRDAYARTVDQVAELAALITARCSEQNKMEARARKLGLQQPRFRKVLSEHLGWAFEEGRTGRRRDHNILHRR